VDGTSCLEDTPHTNNNSKNRWKKKQRNYTASSE